MTFVCARQCQKFGAEALVRTGSKGRPTKVLVSITRRSGSGNGAGFRITALKTEKIAVFAPMPSASVKTATAVKLGDFRRDRSANLRSENMVVFIHNVHKSEHVSCHRIEYVDSHGIFVNAIDCLNARQGWLCCNNGIERKASVPGM